MGQGGLKIGKGGKFDNFFKKGRRFSLPVLEQMVRMLLHKINQTGIEIDFGSMQMPRQRIKLPIFG